MLETASLSSNPSAAVHCHQPLAWGLHGTTGLSVILHHEGLWPGASTLVLGGVVGWVVGD